MRGAIARFQSLKEDEEGKIWQNAHSVLLVKRTSAHARLCKARNSLSSEFISHSQIAFF